MTILSFAAFRKKTVPEVPKDWSQQDMSDFYRAHRLLNDQGIQIGLDHGVTDEDDPWTVFYDSNNQDVFMHIARLDGMCVLLCEHLDLELKARTIPSLIGMLEDAVKDLIEVRAKDSKIIRHPATRIISAISVIFILFKIDNGVANAKSLNEQDNNNTEHLNYRTSETATARSTILSRLFEIIDTPLYAAVIASSLIVSILKWDVLGASTDHDIESDPLDKSPLIKKTAHEMISAKGDVEPAHIEDIMVADDVMVEEISTSPMEHEDKQTISIKIGVSDFEVSQIIANETNEIETATQNEGSLSDIELSSLVVDVDKIDISEDQDGVKQSAVEFLEKLISSNDFLDIFILKSIFLEIQKDQNLFENDRSYKVASNIDKDVYQENSNLDISPGIEVNISSIDIENIDYYQTIVDDFYETKLHKTDFNEAIRIFLTAIDMYTLHFHDGNILFMQDGEDQNIDEIGIWTNVMDDGSEISFVGTLSVMDELSVYLG